ncbi:MAG: hypothetical protein ACKO45_02710 [Cyanobium sp.]
MDQPFAHTLSFDDLEVLVLVEDGGATPREVADFLLTPLARSLRNDEAFSAAAFAAALTGAGTKDQG